MNSMDVLKTELQNELHQCILNLIVLFYLNNGEVDHDEGNGNDGAFGYSMLIETAEAKEETYLEVTEME